MVRIRISPRESILKIFELLRIEDSVTRSVIAGTLGISYWSARYWLEKLAEEKLIRKEVVYIGRKVRRVYYFKVVPVIYYRTQYAMLFYVEAPRTKSPDPIAEFRVVAVSNRKGRWRLDEFERTCIYIGVILSPQTYWIKQKYMVTADEEDEPIDPDELVWSVPAKKMLNYAERYAVFFRSRRTAEEYWRVEHPYYWADPTAPLPAPRTGDYEYDENVIKSVEEKKIALGVLKMRFNNERGIMESVTV